MHRLAGLLRAAGEELILHIRAVQLRPGLDEQSDRRGSGHQRSLARQDPFRAGVQPTQPTMINLIHGNRAIDTAVDNPPADVVLQVLADTGQIVLDLDPE